MATGAEKGEALKRLGGGRWQTRDARFTIEPQSGTWVVVDTEQTDDLGLPLVRGPFGSLNAAKSAIDAARASGPAASPLSARAQRIQGGSSATPKSVRPRRPSKPVGPAEPRWITDLDPGDRQGARRLLARLTDADVPDAEGVARREVVGQVPAAAAVAVVRRIVSLGADASPPAVTRVLVDGRDDELGVRWRLVDGDGRPITLDLGDLDRAADR